MAYSNLKAEMGRRNIIVEKIAKIIGVHRNNASNKINGPSSFSIEEAMIIKNELFPDVVHSEISGEYLRDVANGINKIIPEAKCSVRKSLMYVIYMIKPSI